MIVFLFAARCFISGAFQVAFVYAPEVSDTFSLLVNELLLLLLLVGYIYWVRCVIACFDLFRSIFYLLLSHYYLFYKILVFILKYLCLFML